MKKLRKLNLSNLSKAEMTEREKNAIRGGACICWGDLCACVEIADSGYFNDTMGNFDRSQTGDDMKAVY